MDCDLHYIELKRIFPACSDSFFNAGWKEGCEGSAEACTSNLWLCCRKGMYIVLYVQEVVTRPKILNRTILSNRAHVT